jgi:hypothetical protein
VPFAGHNLFDSLVDGSGTDESVSDDGLVLAYTPRAISSLIFNRGIPPTVIEDDVVGIGEIEARASGFE